MATVFARMDAKIYPEPNTGCWLWAGTTTAEGYPRMSLGTINGKKVVAAPHRLVLERKLGRKLLPGEESGQRRAAAAMGVSRSALSRAICRKSFQQLN